ncbi:hypothetical protein scyTo_0001294 [Scyliorhinus torazame]|uniref:Uncharacterized protein n=1 Tax=Scyliorhinus torazame TaxID=75743 RepID=A0A401PBH9_SCYTO|nr:hypothetical protein [Scyliorhinus torazame]
MRIKVRREARIENFASRGGGHPVSNVRALVFGLYLSTRQLEMGDIPSEIEGIEDEEQLPAQEAECQALEGHIILSTGSMGRGKQICENQWQRRL